MFINRTTIEKFLNNQGSHWFENTSKLVYYTLSLVPDNFKVSTCDQPLGVCFVVEVEKGRPPKDVCEKLKGERDALLRSLYELNPEQLRNVKTMVVILYDVTCGCTTEDAIEYTTFLKQHYGIITSLIFRLPINSE
jgi:hypothetical protein